MIIIAVLGVALAIVSGGAFTIVGIPVAVIAIIAAFFFLGGSRRLGMRAATQADAGASDTVTRFGSPEAESGAGRVPATPEELLEARRSGQ